MNVLARWSIGALILLSALASLGAENQAEDGIAERVIRSHATFLNEISDRRRVNSIFPNEQSSLHGVPIRYVNSSRGNLTFVRRDLVSVGHLPVVLARIYDSSMRDAKDFGVGWRLAAAETITRQSGGEIIYVDDSGSEIVLMRRGGGYVLRDPTPTDIASIRAEGGNVRISLRSGWSKEFSRLRDSFVLTVVRDAHGNAISYTYLGGQLSRRRWTTAASRRLSISTTAPTAWSLFARATGLPEATCTRRRNPICGCSWTIGPCAWALTRYVNPAQSEMFSLCSTRDPMAPRPESCASTS